MPTVTDNRLANFQPSQDTVLATSLMGIETSLAAAALRNIETALGDTTEYTQMEMRSMQTIEELKLVNGLDLAAILLRGKLLKQIEDEALYSFHPNGYGTMEAMAREQGISMSELSNVKDMCFVIFPYMEDVLGMNVALTFEAIGKSKVRELVPVLKAMITGEAGRDTVQAAADRFLDEAAATEATVAASEGREADRSPENLRRHAVENLLTSAPAMTNTEVRAHIRPDRTPAVEVTIVKKANQRIVITNMTEEQYLMFVRKMGAYMEPVEVSLPDDPRASAIEASRVRAIRDISHLME